MANDTGQRRRTRPSTANPQQRNGAKPPDQPSWLRSSNPGPTGSGQLPQPPPRRPWWANIWWVIAVAILIWNVVTVINNHPGQPTLSLPYSTFIDQLNQGNVSTVNIQGTAITGTLQQAITYPPPSPSSSASAQPSASATAATLGQGQPQPQTSSKFSTHLPDFGDPALLPALKAQNVTINVNPESGPSIWALLLENLLPWILLGGLFFFLNRRAGQAQQGIFSFGKSRAKLYRGDNQRITFVDVAGVDEAKDDLLDIIDYLKEPAKYARLGGRVPRGVLLVGPPGTGKTLLARATAGEANVPFYSISGPEFVEVLVGVGASRVRDLFENAKKTGPSIIFIDEIDAVGRRRGSGAFTGSNEEREQTLNQILVEMDGFDASHTVVVLAASNRADVLDPALLRPGRFDRQVTVDRPDKVGREQILRVHVKGVPLGPDVDLAAIARGTPGMVGADLANLVNEAALLAARHGGDHVTQADFWQALEKIQLGAERPLVLNEQDKRIVAYHEGGHALVALLTPNADPLNRVTIVPRGQALGVTLQLPIDDRYNYSKSYLMTRIAVALGGRVAEETVFGDITTGAENDLEMVTSIVRQMVTRWGMHPQVGVLVQADRQNEDLGGLLAPKETSEFMHQKIDEAMQAIVNERLAFTRKLMADNRDKLEQLAELLLEHESLDAAQIRDALGLNEQPAATPDDARVMMPA
ncbi:MAG: ATP-dependent zinc metalloprotease FtsH [Chloroflexi bacterium]|nr:ATP-dependent zinc metalloprotease FtsH [Chloroflexota bacterium]